MQVTVSAEIKAVDNGYIVTVTRCESLTRVFTSLADALTWVTREALGERYDVVLKAV